MRPGAKQFFERRVAPTPPAIPYDAEVKWLESDGNQYIDTGVYSRNNLCITSDFCYFQPEQTTSTPLSVFGGGKSVASRIWFMLAWNNDKIHPILNAWIGTATGVTANQFAGQKIHVVMDTTNGGKYASIDGTTVATSTSTVGDTADSGILLFNGGYNGLVYDGSPCRIYSFSIKDTTTNTILLDLIPVRFTNELGESEGAMYDKVSGQLFRNSGTGKFFVGADVDMPYDYAVEYIETDGVASYIDTGCYAGINFQFDLDFQVASTPSSSAAIAGSICGARIGSKIVEGYFEIDISTANNVFHFRNPSTTATSGGIPYSLDRHTASCSYSGITFDGASVTTVHAKTYDRHSLFFIGRAGVGDVSAPYPERSYANVRVYACVLRDNGAVVFNGIPVVDRNGVACMYDYVSKTLKYNAAASGTITAGPRV